MLRRSLLPVASFVSVACFAGLLLTASLFADPLSKKTEIDFFRDVPSRNLKGLAARSDGRLIAGPVLTELAGAPPADLLWCLEPTADSAKWLVGTGPDGRIFEITIDLPASGAGAVKSAYTTRELIKLDEPHIFALARLPDGSILAGTSPRGALCLIKNGKLTARVALPVDSIFDVLLLPAASNSEPGTPNSKPRAPQALVATGNPGRIYQIDLTKFSAAGVIADKITDAKLLADHGIALFGEIRDRNVRRLVRLTDGRIAAGSSPKGNLYAFDAPSPSLNSQPSTLNSPLILQENRDAEVTDLLPAPDGGLYATITFSGGSGESRITPAKKNSGPASANSDNDSPLGANPFTPFTAEKFGGRGTLVWFPAHGFPETLTARGNTAFYRLARHADILVVTGGEQGEMLGYDLHERLAVTFAGSVASQLNGLAPVPGQPDKFLVLRNNAPGFALLDFAAQAPREAETRRLDLGAPSLLGALRFNRIRDLTDQQISASYKISNGSDELEGWSPWVPLKTTDGGWSAPDQRGRYLKLRLTLPADSPATAQLDKAALYSLPQNRRPQLQDFHLVSPNFGLIPTPDSPQPVSLSVGQILQGKDDDPKHKNSFLSSQIVPSPGAQVVLWTVNDPDGDNLVCTFSLRRDGEANWTDVALNTRDPYAQFDISHLPDGVYFTRLVVSETDPRAAADRLTTTFETDDLVVDHTPPEIVAATARLSGDKLLLTVHGRDALSLLDGFDATFNNGVHEQTEQPADGIRDSRDETFVLELPAARIANATSVEITLYDSAGNTASQRLTW